MITVDLDKIADQLVNQCMRVKLGEVIQVSGDAEAFELLENIRFHILKAGGHPLMNIETESGYRRRMMELPPEILENTGQHNLDLMNHVKGRIVINTATEGKTRGLPMASLQATSRLRQTMNAITNPNRVRSIVASYPTQAMADELGIDFDKFHDLSWRSFLVDLEAVYEDCSRVRNSFGKGEKIHLTSPKGTDIHMSAKGRKIRIDDAIFDEEDLANDFLITNIPCGEVYLAPLEESAEGIAVFDEIFAMGHRIRDLKCCFEKGQVVRFESALDDVTPFQQMLDAHTGDKITIAELGLGMNPEVKEAVGMIFFDEKIYGSCHIAIGDNYVYGGINRSSLHFDMIIMNPTLTVDNTVIFADGKVVV
jgi:leucyl aminopeptidase (aminopeptidase T)